MKTYCVVLGLASAILVSEAIGMGRSDGDKEKVKSSISEKSTVPAETEQVKEAVKEPVKVEPAKVEPAKPIVDKLVVTVNGAKIMQSEVDKLLRPQIERMKAIGRQIPEGMMQQARQQVAESLIVEQLVEEKVKAAGIKITSEEIEAKIKEIAEQQNMSVEDFSQMVSKQGMTMDDARDSIGMRMSFEKIAESEMAGQDTAVTDEEVKRYYDMNSRRYNILERVKARHILAGGRSIDDETRAKAKIKIEEVMKKLKEGGDFEALAREYSDCPSKVKGGDLEVFFDKNGRIEGGAGGMDSKFSEAAFALKVGQTSDIVETPFGYHIIKLANRKEAKTTGFEEVKVEIVKELENNKKRDFMMKYIGKLKSEAKIIWADEFKPAFRPPMPPTSSPKPPAPTPKPAEK